MPAPKRRNKRSDPIRKQRRSILEARLDRLTLRVDQLAIRIAKIEAVQSCIDDLRAELHKLKETWPKWALDHQGNPLPIYTPHDRRASESND